MATEVADRSKTARMWGRGQLTIPRDIRDELGLAENTVVSIVRVGRCAVLTPKVLRRASLARKTERAMRKTGITLEDLLRDLGNERDRYNRETHRR